MTGKKSLINDAEARTQIGSSIISVHSQNGISQMKDIKQGFKSQQIKITFTYSSPNTKILRPMELKPKSTEINPPKKDA